MDKWLEKITEWIVELVKNFLETLKEIVGDAVVWVLDLVLGPLGDLIASIPAPSFFSTVSFSSLLSGLPPYALYVIGQAQLPEAMAIIAAGVSFHLLRKLFTLGQW